MFAAARWASARQARLARAKAGSRARLFVVAGIPITNKAAGPGSLSRQTVLRSPYTHAPEAH
jgi:hypothetical protein